MRLCWSLGTTVQLNSQLIYLKFTQRLCLVSHITSHRISSHNFSLLLHLAGCVAMSTGVKTLVYFRFIRMINGTKSWKLSHQMIEKRRGKCVCVFGCDRNNLLDVIHCRKNTFHTVDRIDIGQLTQHTIGWSGERVRWRERKSNVDASPKNIQKR